MVVDPAEMIDALNHVHGIVDSLTTSPNDWDRNQLNVSIEVWDCIDTLIAELTVLRRDHGVVLARRIADEHTVKLPNGDRLTIHREVPKTEQWDGWQVLGDLAVPVIDANGEKIDAIPVDVARKVIPACGQGAVSSKWKVTELANVVDSVDKYRQVTWGDPIVARGPSRTKHSKPPPAEDPT